MTKTTIFFHGDADGCCSAALILTALKTQAGLVPVLEPSDLERKARRHFGNALFLDLGTVTGKIVRRFSNAMVIDHHPYGPRLPCVHINPTLDGKKACPVSYLVYKMFGGPKRIALAGCIGDWFLPRDLVHTRQTIEEAYYNSRAGKTARAIDSSCALLGENGALLSVRALLLGRVSGKMWKCLKSVEEEVRKNATNVKVEGRLASLVFSSRHRIKSQVAQLIKVRHKNKIIFVGQSVGGNRLKFSLRESRKYANLNSAVRESLKGLAGGGGGHFMASAGWVAKKDFKTFFERLKKILSS